MKFRVLFEWFAFCAIAWAICTTTSAEPFDWQTAAPESQGMSGAKLDAARDDLAKRGTRALLVIRNDRIVCEWYAEGAKASDKQGTASLAKALVGGMSLAVALHDDRIKLDDPAAKYIPEWRDDPLKSKITVRHLGSHTSGLSDSTTKGTKHEEQPGWKGVFWQRLPPPRDPFTIARDETPLLFEPGERLEYSNPGIGLMTYCVTAALRDAQPSDVRSLLRERVYQPIGLRDAEWSMGYGKTFTVDGLPLVGSWGGGSFTPRATARIGRLVLREGDWDGQRVLSPDAIRQVTHDAGLPGHSGMGWWTNGGRRYDWLPTDAVWGAGAGDQVLLVVPSLQLIVVRNGTALGMPGDDHARAEHLFRPIIEAVTDAQPDATSGSAPYPPSEHILSIDWAPADSTVRLAQGSDNWPLTWADDDHQYTAYGDGNGFEPRVPEKLGLGFARIEGSPTDFRGINIRSPAAENRGQGKEGKKASGMLMIEGVLYLWLRNAANSQLAWSHDRGQTWESADWKFTTSFGYPTFINFGRNYAGARDEFVYVVSHDSASAYEPADRMVLARVPKEKLKEHGAYEFFQQLDSAGRPVWTRAIGERGPVFTHPGRCYRSGITYNSGLRRYLWVQILPGTEGKRTDTRFEGGFAVFDAPEPWGPWTTAFFTDKWDVGPGETASFPTKWMSEDGRTLHLVFSGDDCFSVRRATLKVPESK